MARGPNLDTFISAADRALRALLAPPAAGRPVPVPAQKTLPTLQEHKQLADNLRANTGTRTASADGSKSE